MFNNSIASRKSDNNQNGARAIGQLNGTRKFQGAVGVNDKADFYSFTLTGRSSFNLALNKLQNNVDVFLQQGNKVIAQSTKGDKKPEAIGTTLEAGTYYVRVNQKSGNSKYKLTLNATPQSGTGLDPKPARNRLLAIEQKIGESGTRLGLIDLNTGIVTPRPTSGAEAILPWADIAVFGNEGYALVLNSLVKLDPNTGVVTDFPNNALNSTPLTAIEFTSSGELYGVSPLRTRSGVNDRVGGLYKVDIANQQVNLIAEIPNFNGTDFVYDPASNRFFGASFSGPLGYQLYSIGLAGDTRLIGDIGLNGSAVQLNAMLLDNGTLYGYGYGSASAGKSAQFVINTTTGAGTLNKLVTAPSDNDDNLVVFGA
jgi:Bacterial pre-peptidase C-terminal domain